MGEEYWAPYLRQTKISCRGDGCDTEVIVHSRYNVWAMIQCQLQIVDPGDCTNQNHTHLLTTNCLHVQILDKQHHECKILPVAAGSSLNDDAVIVKQEI